MLKDDYIMNIVNQAARVFAQVLARVKEGSSEDAQALIDEALSEFVGMESAEIDHIEPPEILRRLGSGELAGVGRILMLADLLRAEAVIHDAGEDEAPSYFRRLKALDLRLALAIGHDMSNAHLDATIDELVAALAAFQLPAETVQKLFEYYEKTGQFDKAENILFELLDEHHTEDDMVESGLAFYERLLRKTESELQSGSFSKEEVEQGFDELWGRKR